MISLPNVLPLTFSILQYLPMLTNMFSSFECRGDVVQSAGPALAALETPPLLLLFSTKNLHLQITLGTGFEINN